MGQGPVGRLLNNFVRPVRLVLAQTGLAEALLPWPGEAECTRPGARETATPIPSAPGSGQRSGVMHFPSLASAR